MARHVPTKEQRNAVTVMIGLGAPPGIVATAIGITPETLEKTYANELEAGPDMVRLQAMRELFNAAKGDGAGKVTAAVKLLDLLTAEDESNPASGAVRESGETLMVVYRPSSSALWAGDRAVAAYDENGNSLLIISEDEDRI